MNDGTEPSTMPPPNDPSQLGSGIEGSAADVAGTIGPGTQEWIDTWGCIGPYQAEPEFAEGFRAIPEKSSDDCPYGALLDDENVAHPEIIARTFQRKRWMQGYNEAGVVAGLINGSDDWYQLILDDLPPELMEHADLIQHDQVHEKALTATEAAQMLAPEPVSREDLILMSRSMIGEAAKMIEDPRVCEGLSQDDYEYVKAHLATVLCRMKRW